MSVLRDSSTLKSSRRGWKKDWQKSQCKSLNAIRSSGTHTSICLHAGCTREKIQIRGNDDPWRVWFYVPRAKTRPGERSTFFLFSSGGRVTVLSFFDTRLRQTGGRRATTRVNRTKKRKKKVKKEEPWHEREAKRNRGRRENGKKIGWRWGLLIDCLNDFCSADYAAGLALIIAYWICMPARDAPEGLSKVAIRGCCS